MRSLALHINIWYNKYKQKVKLDSFIKTVYIFIRNYNYVLWKQFRLAYTNLLILIESEKLMFVYFIIKCEMHYQLFWTTDISLHIIWKWWLPYTLLWYEI